MEDRNREKEEKFMERYGISGAELKRILESHSYENVTPEWARRQMAGTRPIVDAIIRRVMEDRKMTIIEQLTEMIAQAELGVERDFLIRGEEFSKKEQRRLWFLQRLYKRGQVSEWTGVTATDEDQPIG